MIESKSLPFDDESIEKLEAIAQMEECMETISDFDLMALEANKGEICSLCRGSGLALPQDMIPNKTYSLSPCAICGGHGRIFDSPDPYFWPSFYGLEWRDVDGNFGPDYDPGDYGRDPLEGL